MVARVLGALPGALPRVLALRPRLAVGVAVVLLADWAVGLLAGLLFAERPRRGAMGVVGVLNFLPPQESSASSALVRRKNLEAKGWALPVFSPFYQILNINKPLLIIHVIRAKRVYQCTKTKILYNIQNYY